jgi:hypothetical protein
MQYFMQSPRLAADPARLMDADTDAVGSPATCCGVQATPLLERLLEPADVERIWSRHRSGLSETFLSSSQLCWRDLWIVCLSCSAHCAMSRNSAVGGLCRLSLGVSSEA